MALADYQQLVDSMVRDQASVLSTTERDRAIELARLRYSNDVERHLAEDVTWAQAGFLGPLPNDWTIGAYLLDAEFPIGVQPRSVIELAVYQEPDRQQLVVTDALDDGDVVRVRYAAPHVLTGGASQQDTIPASHREAVASYAAHLLCKQLATYYSGERETPIGADKSSTDTRARNYRAAAKEWRAAYFDGIGKSDPMGGSTAGPGRGQPAAITGTWAGRLRARLVSLGVESAS